MKGSKNKVINGKGSSRVPILLLWPGGKSVALPVLEKLVDPATELLIAPFLGAGSFEMFLMQKNPKLRLVANDKSAPLMNFWRCMKYQRTALVKGVLNFIQCGWGSAQYKASHRRITSHKWGVSRNPILAALYFLVINSSFNGKWHGGYSEYRVNCLNGKVRYLCAPFWSDVMRRTKFYNRDFGAFLGDRALMEKHRKRLVFCDPPYHIANNHYKHTELHFDHQRLAATLPSLGMPYIVCYNEDKQIANLYSDKKHRFFRVRWRIGMKVEMLIVSLPAFASVTL